MAETWLVRKPTRHGIITSVELYAHDRSLIAQFFGTGSIWELNVLGFVLAVVAAVLLIGVAEGVSGGSRRSVR